IPIKKQSKVSSDVILDVPNTSFNTAHQKKTVSSHISSQSCVVKQPLIDLPPPHVTTLAPSLDTLLPFDINGVHTLHTLDNDCYSFEDDEDDENHTPLKWIFDPEGEEDPDDSAAQETAFTSKKGIFYLPPTLEESENAFVDLINILKPPCNKGYKDPGLTKEMTTRLEGIWMFLGTYIRLEKASPGKRGNWIKASKDTVEVQCEKPYRAVKL
ncbi:hypothetical protein C0992_004498, partial [Termitomyces sp. T32_za158]